MTTAMFPPGTWPQVDSLPPDGEVTNPRDHKLTSEEQVILGKLKKQLTRAKTVNKVKNEYYEAKQRLKDIEIAIPPQIPDLSVAVGWPGTVVDVLEERIDFIQYSSTGDLRGLDEIAVDNELDLETSRGVSDSLIAGVSFMTVGKGDENENEPPVLITAESPSSATVVWDYRTRRAAAGLSQTYDERNKVVMQSFYLPDKTVVYAVDPLNPNKALEIVSVNQHNLGRTLMTRLINRDRASDVKGRSEITRAIRYYTDAAVRTMLGMEVNREFYTTPMLALLNVFPDSLGFKDDMSDAEKKKLGWALTMGTLNVVPPQGGDGPQQQINPALVRTTPAPPTPYIEQIKAYSIQVAAESGLPASLLGFVTDNPTSADAIVKGEYRLIRRAERRIQSYKQGLKEVALLSLLVKDGGDLMPADIRDIQVDFRNPATPTRAAEADETQKLVAAEVLPPQSTVTWNRLRFTPAEQAQLKIDWRARQAELAAQQMQEQSQQLELTKATEKAKADNAPPPAAGKPVTNGKPSPTKKPVNA